MATKQELLDRAAELEIEGRSSMTKDELETAVTEAERENVTDAPAASMSETEIHNSLDAWYAAQVASGATAADLDAALGSFEPTVAPGEEEIMTSPVFGHYANRVDPLEA